MAHQSTNPQWTNSASTPINATALENLEGASDTIAQGVFGATGRNRTYAGYAYYTADSSNLSSRTDYIMAGGWGIYSDPDGVVTLGGNVASQPTTMTAPVTGMYSCEFHGISSQTSGYIYGRLLINADNSQTVTTRVINNSFAITGATATGEATHFHIQKPRLLNAGDRVTAAIYSATTNDVTWILRSTFFTQSYVTMFGIRYIGPA